MPPVPRAMRIKPTMDSALETHTHTHWITHICVVCLSSSILSIFNSHVEGHVVGDAIPVVVRDVMNGAHRQDNLTHRVNDGQVNDSPALKGGRIRGEISSTRPFLTTKEYFSADEKGDKEKSLT